MCVDPGSAGNVTCPNRDLSGGIPCMLVEHPAPRLDVGGVGVHEGPVEVEDDSVRRHGADDRCNVPRGTLQSFLHPRTAAYGRSSSCGRSRSAVACRFMTLTAGGWTRNSGARGMPVAVVCRGF